MYSRSLLIESKCGCSYQEKKECHVGFDENVYGGFCFCTFEKQSEAKVFNLGCNLAGLDHHLERKGIGHPLTVSFFGEVVLLQSVDRFG